MLKINKYFILFVVVLMACMSVAVAADAGDSTEPVTTPAVTSTADNVDVQTVAQADNEITKKLDNNIDEEINYEENTRATTHNLDDNNFDEYITDSGLSSTVNEGDILNFTSDVTRTTSSYIINKPINIIGNGFTLDLKLTIGEYSNVTNNTFKNSVTIGRYANINDNTFTTPITINEYSNVTNNIFQSTVTLNNNINFKNNNAENSTLYVNGSNCDLCNDTVNTIVLKSGITNISICFDMFGVNIEGNTSVINWYSHPSSLALTKKSSSSLKNDDGEPQVIDITEENYSTYFRNNTYNSYMMSSVITTDTIFNLYYVPENINQFQILNLHPHHLTFVGKNNLTIRNVKFQIQGSNLLIKDINVIYEDVDFGNVFIGLGFASTGDALPLIWDNITINISKDYDGGTLYSPIRQASASSGQKNIIVRNSVINANLPAANGNSLTSVSGISFINNSINLNETMGVVDSPSLIAMDLTTESGVSVVVEGNNITVLGESNLVGIQFEESVTNSNITNNNITVTSTEATARGVIIKGNDNTVTDNYIVANDKAGNDAVTVTGENNIVENNIGTADTRIATGIELTYDTNPIDVGDRLIIRGVFKVNKVESESSDIKVYDNDELIATTNSDEFGTITYAYTPTASGSHNLTFVFEGNDTHKDASSSITVEVNEVIEPEKEYSLKVDTTEFIQGETTTIKASIYYGNENEEEIATNITKGKVTFKVNGKTLKDLETGKVIYAKVVNGTATIENYLVPDTWDENAMIQAVYSGSSDVEKMTSEKTNITITPKQLTLLAEDTTATTGSTVTLTATLSDNTINNGKIVFKINGKTVKDTNGKVIYAKVVNGTVSVEYTLPANMKAGSYTITAVYVSSDYPKLEDNKTLTIN